MTDVQSAEPYRMAFEQALRTLDQQQATLESIRTRGAVLLAAAAAAAGFLADGVDDKASDTANAFLWIGLALFAAATAAVLIKAMRSGGQWTFNTDPNVIIKNYIEADPPRELWDTYKTIAGFHAGHIKSNAERLDKMHWWFNLAVWLVLAQIAALALAVSVA